jgi:hypothetical protein
VLIHRHIRFAELWSVEIVKLGATWLRSGRLAFMQNEPPGSPEAINQGCIFDPDLNQGERDRTPHHKG